MGAFNLPIHLIESCDYSSHYRFAIRLETNYKRFGGGMLGSGDSSGVPVEMGSSAHSKTNPMADINLNNPDENDNNAKVDYSSSKDKNITVNF